MSARLIARPRPQINREGLRRYTSCINLHTGTTPETCPEWPMVSMQQTLLVWLQTTRQTEGVGGVGMMPNSANMSVTNLQAMFGCQEMWLGWGCVWGHNVIKQRPIESKWFVAWIQRTSTLVYVGNMYILIVKTGILFIAQLLFWKHWGQTQSCELFLALLSVIVHFTVAHGSTRANQLLCPQLQ